MRTAPFYESARRSCVVSTRFALAFSRHFLATRELRLPGAHGSSPVDAFEQHRQLRCREMHRAVGRLRPHEATALQALGVQIHSVAAPPQELHQIAALAAKHKHIARERSLAERRLHDRRQPVHALSHVGNAGGDPHARARGQRDHRSARTIASICCAGALASIAMTALPMRISIAIR